ncbi:hypothetical protein BKA61DRAFT_492534, partial [Leptodontidium sp. MPI-SDFR-AT-0119]
PLEPSALVYVCNKSTVVFTYLAVVGLTFICVCVGLLSLRKNGVSHDSAFSSVFATTRDTNLGELMEGNSLGVLPLASKIATTELQLGLITVPGVPLRRAGFGLRPYGIVKLKKGVEYY